MKQNISVDCGKIKTGKWFRVYADDLNDAKLQTLPLDVRWAWFNLSCLAAEHQGRLPEIDQIAFSLRTTAHAIEHLIGILIGAGLIVQSWGDGRTPALQMAGWARRQYVGDTSTSRVRKFRARKRGVTASNRNGNGDGNVSCNA